MATTKAGWAGGIFDNDAMYLSSGNLTKTALYPSAGMKVRGTPASGGAARVYFPTTPGAHATVLVEIHVSQDDSTYRVANTYPGGALSWASGTKEIIVPRMHDYKYEKIKFTISGHTTGGDSFGAVKAGIVPPVYAEQTRTVDWQGS